MDATYRLTAHKTLLIVKLKDQELDNTTTYAEFRGLKTNNIYN
jgi:hypothetical protein